MDMQTVLDACGIRPDTLSAAEKAQLTRDGYLPLPNILTPEQVYQLGARADELVAAEGEAAGLEVHQETGADRLSDLINKDPRYDVCFTHPRVLAAIWHVLGADFRLSSIRRDRWNLSEGTRPGAATLVKGGGAWRLHPRAELSAGWLEERGAGWRERRWQVGVTGLL